MREETARKILSQIHEDYNTIAADFSATRAFVWNELKPFADLVKPGHTVLDVGCGNGRLYQLLKDKNVSYLGIDSSEKLIELARKKWNGSQVQVSEAHIHDREKVPQGGPQFEVGDILTMQYQKQFDVVFCIAVLHHIPSFALRAKALHNLFQALKPGGTLVLTVWNLWQPRFWRAHARALIKISLSVLPFTKGEYKRDLDFGDLLIPWKGTLLPAMNHEPRTMNYVQRYYHALRAGELRKLLRKSGFKIQESYYVKQGKRTSWWQGNNVVVIAKKV
jgi:alkylated DNA repair protein alkB family protein 8